MTLAQLQSETPEIEKSLVELADVLNGAMPSSLKEVLARYHGLAIATSYQEFDAAVCESYADKDAKAKHGLSKRVRVFLTLDTPRVDLPAASLGPQGGDAP